MSAAGGCGSDRGVRAFRPVVESPDTMTSYVQPRTGVAYMQAFATVRPGMEGYVDVQKYKEWEDAVDGASGATTGEEWKRRYFLLKDGKLIRFKNKEKRSASESEKDGRELLLANVISVRTKTGGQFGDNCFEVEWNDGRVIFRVGSKEERNDWLFGFHASIASILSQLLLDAEQDQTPSVLGGSRFGGTVRRYPVPSPKGGKVARRRSGKSHEEGGILKVPVDSKAQLSSTPPGTHALPPHLTLAELQDMHLEHVANSHFSPQSDGGSSRRDSIDSAEDVFQFDLDMSGDMGGDLRVDGQRMDLISPVNDQMWTLHCTTGSASDIGCRDTMEDELVIIEHLNSCVVNDKRPLEAAGAVASSDQYPNDCLRLSSGVPSSSPSSRLVDASPRHSFYAVYDGHSGTYAAKYVSERLHQYICRHEDFSKSQSDLQNCIRQTFIALDDELLATQIERRDYSGCTAAMALIRDKTLCVALLGDSRVVLCRNGAAEEVVAPHSPGRADERQRIEGVNGWVTKERELLISRLRHMDLKDPFVKRKAQGQDFVEVYRVNGDLGVSRSFGDPEFKEKYLQNDPGTLWNWPKDHSRIFHGTLLESEPDIHLLEVMPSDEFMVLACDGLWDVLTPSETVQKVQEYFAEQDMTETIASKRLLDLALRLGSSDNISIIIVRFSAKTP